MADLSEKEIEDLIAAGATIENNTVTLSVFGMSQILAKMQAMINVSQKIADKNNDSVVEAVNGLTTAVQQKSFKAQDLKPLVAVLADSLNKPVPEVKHPDYNFKIVRNSRGLMSSVEASVVE